MEKKIGKLKFTSKERPITLKQFNVTFQHSSIGGMTQHLSSNRRTLVKVVDRYIPTTQIVIVVNTDRRLN